MWEGVLPSTHPYQLLKHVLFFPESLEKIYKTYQVEDEETGF